MNRTTKKLYVGWQADKSRRWYPIGKVTKTDEFYVFEYLKGADEARSNEGFKGVAQFPDFNRRYSSPELFSFLQNRVISVNRADASKKLRRLDLPAEGEPPEPFEMLSRTYGARTTDRFELFRPPTHVNGRVKLLFFTRGVRHRSEEIQQHWLSESPSPPIRLVHEKENPEDQNAMRVEDAEGAHMGYLPRFYSKSFAELLAHEPDYELRVVKHNDDPAYPQHRFLLEFEGQKPAGWSFLGSDLYESIAQGEQPSRERSMTA
jgi:hypothetical protein